MYLLVPSETMWEILQINPASCLEYEQQNEYGINMFSK